MGLLISGQWQDVWYDTNKTEGDFKRESAKLRNWVTADGTAGPTGKGGFKAESGRYHLYVSLACPWAHRTLIFRSLKGIEKHITVSVVHPDMLHQGWQFSTEPFTDNSALPFDVSALGINQAYDHCHEFEFLHQLYTLNQADYSGRVTVPVLWDKQTQQIVSNESSEIIRMFNSAFDDITGNQLDYYPQAFRKEIDLINDDIYENINNGVYRCGFATSQAAYEAAFDRLFDALDRVEQRLTTSRYLVGNQPTEADWRLFTTLVRFDAVYFGHFKCNLKSIEDYPSISNYLRDLYQQPGIAQTVNMAHIKRHYYFSHDSINPTRIVPKGPELDFLRPHNRSTLFA
jgi:putative glutathione S-transferase